MLKNCPICGKVYPDTGARACADCIREENKQYLIVSEYLRDNKGAKVSQVAEDTGVPEQQILKFLRDGRLEMSGSGEQLLQCRLCGEPIVAGQVCDMCLRLFQVKDSRTKTEKMFLALSSRKKEIR
ncbi:MAG: MerR family transcriptional regulator [Bacillota bacterium]